MAKTIWAIQADNSVEKISKLNLEEKAKYLGMMYAKGAKVYEHPENNEKAEIEKINKSLYEKTDKKLNKIYDWGRKISLEHFDLIYKILGTKFDRLFFESETHKLGKEIVEKN